MCQISKFILIGIAVVMLSVIFLMFTDEDNVDYDHSGIVHDISESKNGFTFYIDTSDGPIRCYSSERPIDLGYYQIKGDVSDDGKIFFIKYLKFIQ